jgi:hypothetical protein
MLFSVLHLTCIIAVHEIMSNVVSLMSMVALLLELQLIIVHAKVVACINATRRSACDHFPAVNPHACHEYCTVLSIF